MNPLKKIIFLVLTFYFVDLHSQNIGISSNGATPNASAMLDIDVSALIAKKGLLIPRVTVIEKTAMNPLPATAQGLIIYQTNGVEGFYYNTSTSTTPNWVYLLSANGNNGGWSLSGNAGTNASTNFIGTTDSVDWVVKTKNTEAIRVTAIRNVGIGTSNPKFDLEVVGDSGIAVTRNTSTTYGGYSTVSPVVSKTSYATCPAVPGGIYSILTDPDLTRPSFFFKSTNGALRAGIFSNPNAYQQTYATASSAFGYYTEATGYASFASGFYSKATGNYATSMGNNSLASGIGSMAITGGLAQGVQSFAVTGIARDTQSISIGLNDVAKSFAVAIGSDNYVTGRKSIVIGNKINSIAANNVTIGNAGILGCGVYKGITNNVENSLMIGFNSDTATVYVGPSAGVGNTGNVGIGTCNPSAKLEVNGQLKVTGGTPGLGKVLVSDATGLASWSTMAGLLSGGTTNYLPKWTSANTLSASSLLYDNGTNVGIGTASPNALVHAHATGTTSAKSIQLTNATTGVATTDGFVVRSSSSDANDVEFVNQENADINFYTNNTQQMTLLSSGNLGVGTNAPTEKLHVIQSTNVNKHVVYGYASQTSGTADYNNVGVAGCGQGNGSNFGYGIGVMGIANNSASYGGVGVYAGINSSLPTLTLGNNFYALYADATSSASNKYAGIFMNGNVGIGTNIPAEKLSVTGSETALHGKNACISLSNSAAGGTNWYMRAGATGTTTPAGGFSIANNSAYHFVIDASGNVGIGCTTPSAKLSVVGNINATGTITASLATACSSDKRFKKEIKPMNNALQNVLKLEGVTYKWRTNEFPERGFNDSLQIGFIAQDIEKIYPQMVVTNNDGYKAVDYSRLTPVLVEAIKEQQTIIDDNKTKIKEKELKIEEMMKRISLLEKTEPLSAEVKK